MTFTGYDSVAATVAQWKADVPTASPQVIGSYRNGRYANNAVAKQAFPNATHVGYDVNASDPTASILDIERGDAVPGQFPGWARAYKGNLRHPCGYASASSVAEVITAMLDDGFKRSGFLIQSAHYGQGAHICGPGTCGYPQADSTQHSDRGPQGQNVDTSLYADHFFGPAPPPKPNPHYAWFDGTRRVLLGGRSEQAIVKEYDRWRATQTLTTHPHRARLALLRGQCRVAAARLGSLPPDAPDHRGWRARELRDRANGHRLV